MPDIFGFSDKASIEKVAKATRYVLGQTSSLEGNGTSPPNAGQQVIAAKLGERGEDPDKHLYEWEQVRFVDGDFVVMNGGLTGTITSIPAIQVSSKEDLEGQIVLLVRSAMRAEDKVQPCFHIVPSLPLGVLFIVNLAQDGGDDGDEAAAPTYTYTVVNFEGRELLTEAEPERPRPNGSFTAATRGYAYFDVTGEPRLAEAWEMPATEVCPEEEEAE